MLGAHFEERQLQLGHVKTHGGPNSGRLGEIERDFSTENDLPRELRARVDPFETPPDRALRRLERHALPCSRGERYEQTAQHRVARHGPEWQMGTHAPTKARRRRG